MKLLITTLLALMVLTGCASSGNRIDGNYVGKIKTGETTEQEVRANLGSPMAASIMQDGSKMIIYSFARTELKASTFIPIVGLFAGGANTETETLQVWFDSNGVVTSHSFNQGNIDSSSGLTAK